MALFAHGHNHNGHAPRFSPAHNHHGHAARRVIIIEQPAACPQFLKTLEVLCTRHPIPIRMKCIGESVSHAGEPMAVYACEYPGCGWREGWVRDRRSGRPLRLWKGVHHKPGQ